MGGFVWNYRHACYPRDFHYILTRKHISDIRHIQQLLPPNISKWTLPASKRWTELGGFYMTGDYEASNRSFAVSMTRAAAVLTGVLCYLGFWYQKMLRRAVAVELDRLGGLQELGTQLHGKVWISMGIG
jgi:hypothetical protein